jgi:uncharacterized protein (DUF2235 family)
VTSARPAAHFEVEGGTVRHLVVCCDGTWNSAEQSDGGVPTPTKVRIFHNALAATDRHGHPQVSR